MTWWGRVHGHAHTQQRNPCPNTHAHSYYYEIRGGGVYIRAGGTAVITGCLFTVNPILITEFLLTTAPETTVRMYVCCLVCRMGLCGASAVHHGPSNRAP